MNLVEDTTGAARRITSSISNFRIRVANSARFSEQLLWGPTGLTWYHEIPTDFAFCG